MATTARKQEQEQASNSKSTQVIRLAVLGPLTGVRVGGGAYSKQIPLL